MNKIYTILYVKDVVRLKSLSIVLFIVFLAKKKTQKFER